MDKLAAMRAFTRVVESGSFVRAARSLDLSTAAVSRLVAQLEDDLGVRLLHRTTRRLIRTEAGNAYYQDCSRLLGDIQDAESAIGDYALTPKGELKILLPKLEKEFVSALLLEYRATCPEVTIDVTTLSRMYEFPPEGYDVAIHIGRPPGDPMVARKLTMLSHFVCASPAYLERHGIPEKPEDLAHHNCLTTTYSDPSQKRSWTFEDKFGAAAQVFLHGDFHSNNADLLHEMALQGAGIIRMPSYLVGDDLKSGNLVALLRNWAIPAMGMFAIYPTNRHISAKVRKFVDILQRASQTLSDIQVIGHSR